MSQHTYHNTTHVLGIIEHILGILWWLNWLSSICAFIHNDTQWVCFDGCVVICMMWDGALQYHACCFQLTYVWKKGLIFLGNICQALLYSLESYELWPILTVIQGNSQNIETFPGKTIKLPYVLLCMNAGEVPAVHSKRKGLMPCTVVDKPQVLPIHTESHTCKAQASTLLNGAQCFFLPLQWTLLSL